LERRAEGSDCREILGGVRKELLGELEALEELAAAADGGLAHLARPADNVVKGEALQEVGVSKFQARLTGSASRR